MPLRPRSAFGQRPASEDPRLSGAGLPTQQSQAGVAEQDEPARFDEEHGQDDDYLSLALGHASRLLPKLLHWSNHALPVLRRPYVAQSSSWQLWLRNWP